jgi:hypothetical protein
MSTTFQLVLSEEKTGAVLFERHKIPEATVREIADVLRDLLPVLKTAQGMRKVYNGIREAFAGIDETFPGLDDIAKTRVRRRVSRGRR